MIAVPAVTPVTKPLITVADEVLLLQAPPVIALLSVVIAATHTEGTPVIVPASGCALTVIAFVAVAVPQLLVTEYEIVVVPSDTPVTTPAETVATEELLAQTPPVTVVVSVVAANAHTVPEPVTMPGSGNILTIKFIVSLALPQLLVTVYDITVVPVDTPLTIPAATVAAALLALQVPPATALLSVVTPATQTWLLPVIMPGSGAARIVMLLYTALSPYIVYTMVSVPA